MVMLGKPTIRGTRITVELVLRKLAEGATIEDLDIADITHMIARTDDARALALYEGLRCGSRNHMRSFAGQLQAQDQVYEAQYIEADDLAAILAGGHETCALP